MRFFLFLSRRLYSDAYYLLLSVLQSKIERRWSFSGLATLVRIMLMYYLDLEKLLNQPDADWKIMIAEAADSPPDNSVN